MKSFAFSLSILVALFHGPVAGFLCWFFLSAALTRNVTGNLYCWTAVPTYQRTDIGQLNGTVGGITAGNYGNSLNVESQNEPNKNALRLQYPAQVLSDMNLGGNLRSDTQDQIVKNALNEATSAGIANSFSTRGAVAQDIGKTAEELRQVRLGKAGDYVRSEPLDYIGLNGGQLAATYIDDKERAFQNQKDKVQAQQADTATDIAIGLGVLDAI
jgi:hypothetical protein